MSESKSLMALVDKVSEIEQMLLESGGELTPQLEEMLQVTETHLPEKIDNYSLVIERMNSISDFYKARAEMLIKMAKAATNVSERCKENLKSAMEVLGTEELIGVDTKFKLVNSNPSCVIEDESKIDGAYLVTKTVTTVDKKKIGEDLKLGVPVPGARLERGRSLRQYANTPNKKAVSK